MRNGSSGVSWIFVALLSLLPCLGLALHWAGSHGRISHTVDTTITARPDWFIAQSKECVSYPMDAQAATAAHQDAGYAVDAVYCDSGPARQIKVTFYGRLSQPEYDVVNWRCERNSDGFTCYELSGERLRPEH